MWDPKRLVAAYLDTLERRDWDAFSALLHPDVVYELPQSRERIRGRARFVLFNQVLGLDGDLVTSVTDFWPEPFEPPPGREHLVERW